MRLFLFWYLGGQYLQRFSMASHTEIAIDVPLDIVDIEHTEVRDAYGYDLVLIRPDQHIAWRGNSITSVAEKLLRKATGWQ